jgi:hypothetical protein
VGADGGENGRGLVAPTAVALAVALAVRRVDPGSVVVVGLGGGFAFEGGEARGGDIGGCAGGVGRGQPARQGR